MNLCKLRKQARLTQKQLSEKSGVSRSAIARAEAGQVKPNATNLTNLATALNCTVDELLQPDVNAK